MDELRKLKQKQEAKEAGIGRKKKVKWKRNIKQVIEDGGNFRAISLNRNFYRKKIMGMKKSQKSRSVRRKESAKRKESLRRRQLSDQDNTQSLQSKLMDPMAKYLNTQFKQKQNSEYPKKQPSPDLQKSRSSIKPPKLEIQEKLKIKIIQNNPKFSISKNPTVPNSPKYSRKSTPITSAKKKSKIEKMLEKQRNQKKKSRREKWAESEGRVTQMVKKITTDLGRSSLSNGIRITTNRANSVKRKRRLNLRNSQYSEKSKGQKFFSVDFEKLLTITSPELQKKEMVLKKPKTLRSEAKGLFRSRRIRSLTKRSERLRNRKEMSLKGKEKFRHSGVGEFDDIVKSTLVEKSKNKKKVILPYKFIGGKNVF
jgi:hypothetical protein